MVSEKSDKILKIATAAAFLGMIVVNALANILPINNVTTGEVSDTYPNLFAPAGYTFSIWGLIYLLLFEYVLYQLGLVGKNAGKAELLQKVNLYFFVSCIANILWIFSWHYHFTLLSVAFMAIILFCLIVIVTELSKVRLCGWDYVFLKLPFSVYFGWITVATIANITTLLVDLGVPSFTLLAQIITVLVLMVGVLIAGLVMKKFQDIAYGAVILWAYVGILVKQLSKSGFNGQYLPVIIAAAVCLAAFAALEVYYILKHQKCFPKKIK